MARPTRNRKWARGCASITSPARSEYILDEGGSAAATCFRPASWCSIRWPKKLLWRKPPRVAATDRGRTIRERPTHPRPCHLLAEPLPTSAFDVLTTLQSRRPAGREQVQQRHRALHDLDRSLRSASAIRRRRTSSRRLPRPSSTAASCPARQEQWLAEIRRRLADRQSRST